MTSTTTTQDLLTPFPDHTQLPDEDGTFVKNFQEHPQSILLTDSIGPILQQRHPDGQYCIGQDSGIYWRETEPPERGAEAPDWFYVPNVPPLLDGQIRRSYVLWREHIAPMIALEFATENGAKERDITPVTGKYWVYERVMRIPYYGIYEFINAKLEVYQLINGYYELMPANSRGHYLITPLGVELGLWQGNYQNTEFLWLRWWDKEGNLLLTGDERAQIEQQRATNAEARATNAEARATNAEARAALLAERLKAAGIDPDEV